MGAKRPEFLVNINLASLSVCLFVSNKRQNVWTDRAQIFCVYYLLTRRSPVYFISNTNFYKWNKSLEESARSALNF